MKEEYKKLSMEMMEKAELNALYQHNKCLEDKVNELQKNKESQMMALNFRMSEMAKKHKSEIESISQSAKYKINDLEHELKGKEIKYKELKKEMEQYETMRMSMDDKLKRKDLKYKELEQTI